MMNNLYTFSKTAWHVRLFKWLYNTDPTKTFNTMCPYFWSMVLTLLLLPLICIFKLFGKAGTSFLSKAESYKRDRRERRKIAFIEKCNNNLTNEECYNIRKSKCYDDFRYDLDYKVENFIDDGYRIHKSLLSKIKYEKKEKNSTRVREIKTSKYFPYFAYTVTGVILCIILYGFYLLGSNLYSDFEIDYEVLKAIGTVLGIITVFAGVFYIFLIYIVSPMIDHLKCVKFPKCKLGFLFRPFIFLGKGIFIVCDMVYMTYKKACPRITWKQ